MNITFEEIAVKATKRWIGPDGKRKQETKTFSQTLNPFNKNAAGNIKTRQEINAEIMADRAAWLGGDND